MNHKIRRNIVKHDSAIRLAARFVTAFSIFIVISTLFVRVAREAWGQGMHSFDTNILTAVNNFSDHFLNVTMPTLTDVGSPAVVVVIMLILCALFVYKNEQYRAFVLLISVSGALVTNIVLKTVFARERPSLIMQLVQESGYSFPSGHAMASAALGIALTVALWHSRWRWWALVASSGYIVFVGYSRLYLGVHYPSDIIAGWMLSAGWVAIATIILKTKLSRRTLHRTP